MQLGEIVTVMGGILKAVDKWISAPRGRIYGAWSEAQGIFIPGKNKSIGTRSVAVDH